MNMDEFVAELRPLLETAAGKYADSAANHALRLEAMILAVGAASSAFRRFPALAPLLAPYVDLVASLDQLVQGAKDATLRPVKRDHAPTGGGRSISVQALALIGAHLLIRSGIPAGTADREIAVLLTKYDFPKQKSGAFSQATIRDWRSKAGRYGDLRAVGEAAEAELAKIADRTYSPAEARKAVAAMLAHCASAPGLLRVSF